MQNLINFFSSYLGFGILVVIAILLYLWSVAYKAETKRLAVKYAKEVYKKYKESRSKQLTQMYSYLSYSLTQDNPSWSDKKINKYTNRILKQWGKALSKPERIAICIHNPTQKINRFNYYKAGVIWFPYNDKDSRMYHLKKVISRNSK